MQLQAYNLHDAGALCDLYSADPVLTRLNDGVEICRGKHALCLLYTRLFKASPGLHCEIGARIAMGNFVIDLEWVRGVSEGVAEAIVIYEVRDRLIQTVRIVRAEESMGRKLGHVGKTL